MSHESLTMLATLLEEYSLTDTRDIWAPGWETSWLRYPKTPWPILSVSFVDTQCRALELDDDIQEALVYGVGLFARHPSLLRLLWHCHATLFLGESPMAKHMPRWPALPSAIDDQISLFYAYAFLAHTPAILAAHRQRDIPHAVTLATLRDLQVWMRHYSRTHGQLGLAHDQVNWLVLHFSGRMFQLGRLQFEFSRYYYDFHAFRHEHDGRMILLAGPEMRFRANGSSDRMNLDPDAWTSTLTVTDTAVTGYPIHPRGYALSDSVTLSRAEWRETLRQHDTTVGVHIPGTGRMDFDACGHAFSQAGPFFGWYFPDRPIHAYTCTSWLLDPEFEDYLHTDTNIVRFLREWYLTPIPNAEGSAALRRVFGVTVIPDDLNTLPQQTSLQRAIARHLAQGGHCRSGAGVMFPHNLEWGAQVYRRTYHTHP